MRLSKTVGSIQYTYLYHGGNLIQETRGSRILDYFYDANGQAIAVRYKSKISLSYNHELVNSMTTYKGIPKSRIIMLPIAVLILSIVYLAFFILFEQVKIPFNYSGFGMDSHGTLYVGTNQGIQMYKDGVLTGSINTEVSQNKKLVILKDDTILLETYPDYTRIDSNGSELEHIEKDSVDSQTFEAYGHLIFRFTSSDGTEYCVKHPFLRTTVYNETGETIFQMPLRDYIVRLCFIICFISIFGFGFWFVLSTVMLMKKHSKTNKILY